MWWESFRKLKFLGNYIQMINQKITQNPYDTKEDLGYEIIFRVWGKEKKHIAKIIEVLTRREIRKANELWERNETKS